MRGLETNLFIALDDHLRHSDPKTPQNVKRLIAEEALERKSMLYDSGMQDTFRFELESVIIKIENYVRKKVSN